MTIRQETEVLAARDEIVAPPAQRACDDQSFELPGGIYLAMGLMFAGFTRCSASLSGAGTWPSRTG